MKIAVKILKYFLISFFVLSVASSQSYTQKDVLEIIKERDLQWEGGTEKMVAEATEAIEKLTEQLEQLENE